MSAPARSLVGLVALALLAIVVSSGCRTGARTVQPDTAPAAQSSTLYSRVGLHAESKKGAWYMYSTNYVGLPKSLPPGTRFGVRSRGRDQIELALDDGSTLRIRFVAKHNRMSFDDWLARQFSEPPFMLPDGLSAAEQAAIAAGRYEVGMSRRALFLAIGYPPASLTPSMEGTPLLYQVKRFNKVAIHFGTDDRISTIQN